MSNVKAALKGLVTLGEMKELLVNNGLCNIPGQYFLDATFGKNLQDQVTDVNNKILWFPTQHMIDSDIGTIATKYNVPDYKVYITSNRPINDENFLFGGGSYSIMGMEYGNHQHGYQYTMGSYKSMYRTLAYGIWQDWKTIITDENLMNSLKIIDVVKIPMSSIYDSLPQFSIDIKYVIECGDAPVSNDGLCITFKRIQIYGWQIFLTNNIESNKVIFIRNWYGQNNPGGWKRISLT